MVVLWNSKNSCHCSVTKLHNICISFKNIKQHNIDKLNLWKAQDRLTASFQFTPDERGRRYNDQQNEKDDDEAQRVNRRTAANILNTHVSEWLCVQVLTSGLIYFTVNQL